MNHRLINLRIITRLNIREFWAQQTFLLDMLTIKALHCLWISRPGFWRFFKKSIKSLDTWSVSKLAWRLMDGLVVFPSWVSDVERKGHFENSRLNGCYINWAIFYVTWQSILMYYWQRWRWQSWRNSAYWTCLASGWTLWNNQKERPTGTRTSSM